MTPPGRFGALQIQNGEVTEFVEKPLAGDQVINGGFFVLSPRVLDYIVDDSTVWEHEPLRRLAAERQLNAYPHAGFWQPMDTIRERELLEELWDSGKAPWSPAARHEPVLDRSLRPAGRVIPGSRVPGRRLC